MSQLKITNSDPKFLDFLKTEADRLDLSKAEWQALFLAAGGDDISAIARQLEIKVSAVRQRLSQVYQKFEVEGQGPVKFYNLQKLLHSRYQQWQLSDPVAEDSSSKQPVTRPPPRLGRSAGCLCFLRTRRGVGDSQEVGCGGKMSVGGVGGDGGYR